MNSVLIVAGLAGFGLLLGSFINALVWRLHQKRNWVTERSECPHCHHQLAPKDLVPVVSYVLLRGKCRYCKHKIDDTPLAELLLPAIWLLSYFFWPMAFEGVGVFLFGFWLLISLFFVVLTIYDLRWFLLPNKIVFPLIGIVAVQTVLLPILYHYSWQEAFHAGLGAALISGMFYILFQLSDGTWIGGGDVKLAIALGLIAGDPLRSCLLLFFASLIGSLAAVPAIIKHGLRPKIKLPFGPLLIAAAILVQLFGSNIIDWYVRLISV